MIDPDNVPDDLGLDPDPEVFAAFARDLDVRIGRGRRVIRHFPRKSHMVDD